MLAGLMRAGLMWAGLMWTGLMCTGLMRAKFNGREKRWKLSHTQLHIAYKLGV